MFGLQRPGGRVGPPRGPHTTSGREKLQRKPGVKRQRPWPVAAQHSGRGLLEKTASGGTPAQTTKCVRLQG